MLRRNPIPPNIKFSNYNNNNLHEYDPYIKKDNKVIIDIDWWNTLTLYIKDLIKSRINNFELDKIEVPHPYIEDDEMTDIYQGYLDGFDYNIWYSNDIPNGPKGIIMIEIPNWIKKILVESKKSNIEDLGFWDNYIAALMLLKYKISDSLVSGTEYFLRLSGTSGKNEQAPRPFSKPEDILAHLLKLNIIFTREYKRSKPTYIILIPWNDNIDVRNEFRIFVVNNKLSCASPQRWWEVHNYSPDELEYIEKALNNIKFIGKIPYNTFVADVYINHKSCNLIELNPFGAHCGAGSSLFNWIDDYDQLHGKCNNSELRYLSIIKY